MISLLRSLRSASDQVGSARNGSAWLGPRPGTDEACGNLKFGALKFFAETKTLKNDEYKINYNVLQAEPIRALPAAAEPGDKASASSSSLAASAGC